MREINHIVIHCSATRPEQDIDADTIRQWHKNYKGWRDIGYHYVIKLNGTLQQGRDTDGDGFVLEEVGAHAQGYNSKSLGICYVGGIDDEGEACDTRTDAQKETMKSLVLLLKELFPNAKIIGHRDIPGVAKDCPSFDVATWLKEIGC